MPGPRRRLPLPVGASVSTPSWAGVRPAVSEALNSAETRLQASATVRNTSARTRAQTRRGSTMNRTTKIGVVALLLLYAVASPVYVLFGYPRAFGSVARGLVIASVVLGLVTGVIGIWLWNRARPGEELRLLPIVKRAPRCPVRYGHHRHRGLHRESGVDPDGIRDRGLSRDVQRQARCVRQRGFRFPGEIATVAISKPPGVPLPACPAVAILGEAT